MLPQPVVKVPAHRSGRATGGSGLASNVRRLVVAAAILGALLYAGNIASRPLNKGSGARPDQLPPSAALQGDAVIGAGILDSIPTAGETTMRAASSSETRVSVATDDADAARAIKLQFQYDVHRRMASRAELLQQTATQFSASCSHQLGGGGVVRPATSPTSWDAVDWGSFIGQVADGRSAPPAVGQRKAHPASFAADWAKLREEFAFPKQTSATVDDGLDAIIDPYSSLDMAAGSSDAYAGSLPCTAEAQRRLAAHQSDCRGGKFLESKLKEGAHGVGSAVTLLAHDFLGAMMVGRVFTIARTRWYFAPKSCAAGGWNCLYTPPTNCSSSADGAGGSESVSSIGAARRSRASTIRKKAFDISGLSRNDAPTLLDFFGGSASPDAARCAKAVEAWAKDGRQSIYLMGTFARGADPILGYMMAQVTRYLMRAPKAWFATMLRHHVAQTFKEPGELGRAVYVQDRGEVAKYREYFNAFGCHTFQPATFAELPLALSGAIADSTSSTSSGSARRRPVLYVSGNTPLALYRKLSERYTKELGWSVRSVWAHPAVATGESERWGASAPFTSWTDLYVGAGAGAWVCAVQSNWCRVINFLRLTARSAAARPHAAACPFVDLGLLMLANATARDRYCLTDPAWPTKPYAGAVRL